MSEDIRVDFSEVGEIIDKRVDEKQESSKNQDIPSCKSCGVPWEDHLGIAGTCSELKRQELRADALYNMIKLLYDTAGSALKHMKEDE